MTYARVAEAVRQIEAAGQSVTTQKIIDKIGGSKRDVLRYLQQLRDQGSLHPEPRGTETHGEPFVYKVSTVTRVMRVPEASAILLNEHFERQRAIRQYHVNFLAQVIEAGHFRAGTQIGFAVCQGKRYLVNGQHTLSAMVKAGASLLLDIQETQVETMDEVASLYSRYDRGLPRTLRDSTAARGFADTYGFTAKQTHALGAAIPHLASGFTGKPGVSSRLGALLNDADLLSAMMGEWAEEARAYFGDLGGAPKFLLSAMLRAAVLSLALVTYRYTGSDASDFWRSVAKDDGLTKGDPAKACIHFLSENPAGKYAVFAYSRYVAATWNAAFAERRLIRPHARDMSKPIFIAGTPHDGTSVMQYLSLTGDVLHDPIALGSSQEDAA